MRKHARMRRLAAALPLACLPLLLLSACGDDGDEASKPGEAMSTTSTVPVLDADDIDRSKSPYCNTWADIRSQGGPDTGGMDDAAKVARRKEYYGGLLPLVERLLEQSTDEIRPAVEIALRATKESASTGSFEPFQADDAEQSGVDLRRYALENCSK